MAARGQIRFSLLFIFLGAQEGFAVCIDTKVSKKSSQQIGFFAHNAFTLQSGQNHGCNYFAPLRSRFPNASAKTCYALSCAQGLHCSARFRPKLTC
ncbi:hypothetical protein [Mucilaginibacter sp.]|uniref:hypothetical protein n=1 Tax=Mucilaginibacter sp. TaxID=1882438 RepID=UPI002ED641D8